ncbi:hypothetical protein M5689_020412 [Euphorbia peplus]|nr:hypothetical protein M5689_020412 [Euphorbia peplus]
MGKIAITTQVQPLCLRNLEMALTSITILYMRGLAPSPAYSNENLSLERSGNGNPRSVRSLTRVVRKNCPSLVFISETRLHKKEVEKLRWRFTNYNFFSVDAVGRSGGLMLMWCKEFDLAILWFCDHCIHFGILNSDGVMFWRGTGIYGWPQKVNKFKTWEMMRDLH